MNKRLHSLLVFMFAHALLLAFSFPASAESHEPRSNSTSWDMAAEKYLPLEDGTESAGTAQTTGADGNIKRESDLLQRLENTKNSAKDLME